MIIVKTIQSAHEHNNDEWLYSENQHCDEQNKEHQYTYYFVLNYYWILTYYLIHMSYQWTYLLLNTYILPNRYELSMLFNEAS